MPVTPLTLAEIQTKCGTANHPLTPRNDPAVADIVNANRTTVVTRLGGIGAVMEALGPTAGAALLDSLTVLSASNSAVKWAMVLLNNATLDFGLSSTRTMIQQVVTDVPTQTALLNIASVPDLVSVNDISNVLNAAGM